ncbi:MAG: tetratricopeptide repeat protein [Vicinamibacteria bacterium]|nr:tetratricopeptide repeat protein [Vicinamibacteria bacterium]
MRRALRFMVMAWLLAGCCVAGTVTAGAAQAAEALAARAAQGAAALQASRFDDAAAIYGELVEQRPKDPGLLLNLGMARYMAGQPAEAIAPLQKALALNPSLAPASLFLGGALLDTGRVQDAVAPLRKAVSALPDNADARDLLARAYLALSKFANAAAQFRALTGLQPDNPRAWYGMARSYAGVAEATLTALQTTSPDSPLLELIVADVAVTQEKFPAALAIYRRALKETPLVGGLHEAVADLYEQAGHPDWAAAERAKINRRTPAYCATRAAECHFLAARIRESLAAALASPTPAGRYWTIRAANRLSTEAVAHLETLPQSVELHLIRAEIAQSRGQHPESVKEMREALALAPGDPAVETALAEALLRAHDLKEAIPLVERLNRERPGDASLLLMLGDALVEDQQLDRAIAVLEQAAKAPDALPHAPASLGRAYVQAGRYEESLPFLQAAAATDQDGDVHYQLARAYQALLRPAEAAKAMAVYQQKKGQEAPPSPDAAPEAVLTPPE